MKGYTDIEQSKRLADILPIESADMSWVPIYDENRMMPGLRLSLLPNSSHGAVPCWSLTALLAQMPCVELVSSQDNKYRVFWKDKFSEWYENAVDACVELITRSETEK